MEGTAGCLDGSGARRSTASEQRLTLNFIWHSWRLLLRKSVLLSRFHTAVFPSFPLWLDRWIRYLRDLIIWWASFPSSQQSTSLRDSYALDQMWMKQEEQVNRHGTLFWQQSQLIQIKQQTRQDQILPLICADWLQSVYNFLWVWYPLLQLLLQKRSFLLPVKLPGMWFPLGKVRAQESWHNIAA